MMRREYCEEYDYESSTMEDDGVMGKG